MKTIDVERSLAFKFPEIAKQWDYEKNGELKPENVFAMSGKKVWWVCDKGHKWETQISTRTRMKCNCPYCGNKKVLKGYNDLATTHPEIAKQWHPTKNGNLKPTDVPAGSNKKVWWVCDKGHEWTTNISNRILAHTGCPYCVNQKILVGYNDLATTHPEIAKQWHPTKNGNLTPEMVTVGSRILIWWINKDGKEQLSTVVNKTARYRNSQEYKSYKSQKDTRI